ncbi:uncharacterized protein [Mytilus edulis]|uniref:uncharacterized protein n=1 Tax=Mytilus edulis TaxID=6550 RepID=UPI0039F13C90
MGDPRWIQSADDMEKWSTNTKVCLPLLEKPIEKMSLIDLRTTIPQLLRAERGRKQVGWAKNNCIPVWWPLDALPFKNVNQKPQDFEGNWMNALRLVISSCLSHHGFTPETHYIGAPFIPTRRLSESASSESTSIQTSPECSLNKSSSFKESDSSSDFKAKENNSELSLGSPIFSSSPEINIPGSPNHKEDSSTTDSSSSKETSLISPESPSPSLLLRKRVAHTPVGRGKRLKRRKIPFTPNK